MDLSLKILTFLFICYFPSIGSSQIFLEKKVLLEEFTSTNTEEAAQQSVHLDSIADSYGFKTVRIKYHTEFEGTDPFYDLAKDGVDQRLQKYDFINSVPQVVLEGNIRPEGEFPVGSSGNLNRDHIWDALVDPNYYFFSIEHTFTEDYKEMFVSGGGVSSGIGGSSTVYYTQAIIEEVVNLEEPLGPDDQLQFNYVFRSFVKYREATSIPGNGSYHGWDKISIPSNILKLDHLGVVHIFEDANGKVLNCFYDDPFDVDEYKLITSVKNNVQESYHNYFIQPHLTIRNKGALAVSEFYIAIELGDTTIIDTVYQELEPSQEFTYVGDTVFLQPGKHTVGLYLESFKGQIPQAIIVTDGRYVDYFVYGDYDLPNEGFEANAGIDEAGDFMVKDKNEYAFRNVSGEYFNSDHPAGAFGRSDRCLMVDFFNWEYDDIDDLNNHSALLYGRFDLPGLDLPKLRFDVAFASENNFYVILELTIMSKNRTKKYKYREDHLASMPEQPTFMKPDSNLNWREISIDMYDFMGDEDVTLEFKVNNTTKKFNALYLDNIRMVNVENYCAPGGLNFSRQTQIDSFPVVFGECNIVQGDLCIGNCYGISENDIVNLAGISNLSKLQGDLTITGLNTLDQINSLEEMQEIEGSISIHSNAKLKNLSGFQGLKKIGGHVEIYNNPYLYQIGSLGRVDTIPGDFYLEGSSTFNSMEGLENIKVVEGNLTLKLEKPRFFEDIDGLEYVGGSIVFDSCSRMLRTFTLDKMDTLHGDFILDHSPSLGRMSVLPNVKVIEGDLVISQINAWYLESFGQLEEISGDLVLKDLGNLQDVSQFTELVTIGGDLVIERADSLNHLDELRKLNYIEGTLSIQENPSLLSIDGIGGLDSLSLSPDPQENASLIIKNNPILSLCDNTFICNFLDNRLDESIIENNDFSCSSVDEVIASCLVGMAEGFINLINVFPNPVDQFIQIIMDVNSDYLISSMEGQILLKGKLNSGKNVLDLGDLKTGIYILHLGGQGVFKLVKE